MCRKIANRCKHLVTKQQLRQRSHLQRQPNNPMQQPLPKQMASDVIWYGFSIRFIKLFICNLIVQIQSNDVTMIDSNQVHG